MVLGKLPVPGRPTILITVGQGPIVLALGAGGLDIFTHIYPFSSFSLNPKQPTNKIKSYNPKEVGEMAGPSPREREKENRSDR